jgi:hypothetical protein
LLAIGISPVSLGIRRRSIKEIAVDEVLVQVVYGQKIDKKPDESTLGDLLADSPRNLGQIGNKWEQE